MQKEHKAALQRILPTTESTSPEANVAEDDDRVANLQAQVTALQRDLGEKTSALESKRRQLNDNRQIIEAADSAIRTIENRLKCTEGQNDRLRSELGEAQNLMRDSQARVSNLEESLRRAQDQLERLEGERAESDKKHAAKVGVMGRSAGPRNVEDDAG
jgi:chromosome segregation ATPase